MTANTAQRAAQQRIDPMDQKLQSILEGKEPAPSELCEYLAQSVKEAIAEREELAKKIQEGEQVLAQLKSRLAAVQGVGQKAIQDLRKKLAPAPALHAVTEDEPAEEPKPETL